MKYIFPAVSYENIVTCDGRRLFKTESFPIIPLWLVDLALAPLEGDE